MDKYGLDVLATKVQEVLATADFTIWTANLTARKNYNNGIFAPASGSPGYITGLMISTFILKPVMVAL